MQIEIYDGERLLATVVADILREDLRDAGKGDGRHGFFYSLERHIRDRRAHHITARVADTGIVLRDEHGAIPAPVRRRDRPSLPPIPHLSMSWPMQWFYFSFLNALLRPFKRPIYRVPGAILATIMACMSLDTWRLNRALADACDDGRAILGARLRLHWLHCYAHQVETLLTLQSARLRVESPHLRARWDGTLPAGGAILLAPHHALMRIGLIALRPTVENLGIIWDTPRSEMEWLQIDPTLRALWEHDIQIRRLFDDNIFTPAEAARKGMRFLEQGGYLVLLADQPVRSRQTGEILGKDLPPGAAWFAARAGKPIVPFTTALDGLGWRLWLGAPISPTPEGLRAGLDACIRQSPATWQRMHAMRWLDNPEAGDQAGAGAETPTPGIRPGRYLRSLQQTLDEKERRFAEVEAHARALEQQIDVLGHARTQAEEFAASLRMHIEKRDRRFAETDAYAASLRAQMDEKERRFAELERYVAALRADAEERDRRFAKIERYVGSLKETITKLEQQHREATDYAVSLRQHLEDQNRHLAETAERPSEHAFVPVPSLALQSATIAVEEETAPHRYDEGVMFDPGTSIPLDMPNDGAAPTLTSRERA